MLFCLVLPWGSVVRVIELVCSVCVVRFLRVVSLCWCSLVVCDVFEVVCAVYVNVVLCW